MTKKAEPGLSVAVPGNRGTIKMRQFTAREYVAMKRGKMDEVALMELTVAANWNTMHAHKRQVRLRDHYAMGFAVGERNIAAKGSAATPKGPLNLTIVVAEPTGGAQHSAAGAQCSARQGERRYDGI